MLRITYDACQNESLIYGAREDYANFSKAVRQVVETGRVEELAVHSNGLSLISHLVVRRGNAPNRVFHDRGRMIFHIAPALLPQFLSYIEFPTDEQLPNSPVVYHHHFDGLGDDGKYVAPDSLPVVFSLKK